MKNQPFNKLLNALTKDELATLKSNYEFNEALFQNGLNPTDFGVVVKFFNPTGIGTWYLTELSPENIGFGLCHLQEFEFGYVCLDELAALRVRGGLSVEKDRYFSEKGIALSALSKKLKTKEHL